MSWEDDYYSDPYNSPAKHNLVLVDSIEWSDESYHFDLTAVWHDPTTDEFFWYSDSGCSCPSPFEDVKTRDDLDKGTRHDAITVISERAKVELTPEYEWRSVNTAAQASAVELISKILLAPIPFDKEATTS